LHALTRRRAELGFRRDAPTAAKDWNEVLQRVERDAGRLLPTPRVSRNSFGPDR
jgi:hypothetical protein